MPRIRRVQPISEPVGVVTNLAPTDIIPGDSFFHHSLLPKMHQIAHNFGYQRVETSPIESVDFFNDFRELISYQPERHVHLDASIKKYGLRHQNFLSILRAYATNRVFEREKVSKWYYMEPSFLVEKGLVAHKYEFGAVRFGEPTAISDAHLISMIKSLLDSLGLHEVVFEINNKGCDNCTIYYQEVLSGFLQQNRYEFCPNCQQLIAKDAKRCPHNNADNYLSVFNCPNSQCERILSDAPQVIDYLDASCHRHFANLLETLDELEIAYQLNPRLFGSHWLSHTIFRVRVFSPTNHEESVDLGIGGRHNCFVSKILGQEVPTLLYTVPMDVISKLVSTFGIEPKNEREADVFLINLSDLAAKKSMRLFLDLWKNQISVCEQFGENGIKNQFKMAEKKGCPLALIVGQKEAMDGTVILRDVRSGTQEVFGTDRIIEEVRKRLQD